MWGYPYTHCVPSAFSGRAGCKSCLPQVVLTTRTLVGGGPGAGGARAGIGFISEAGLPLCSVAITSLLGAGSDPKLLEQKP